jgi:hypothetical protein
MVVILAYCVSVGEFCAGQGQGGFVAWICTDADLLADTERLNPKDKVACEVTLKLPSMHACACMWVHVTQTSASNMRRTLSVCEAINTRLAATAATAATAAAAAAGVSHSHLCRLLALRCSLPPTTQSWLQPTTHL